jgi:hypothetical protein
VHGKDAVVVVDAAEWDRLEKPISGRDLVEALANSPLKDVPIGRLPVKSPVRSLRPRPERNSAPSRGLPGPR